MQQKEYTVEDSSSIFVFFPSLVASIFFQTVFGRLKSDHPKSQTKIDVGILNVHSDPIESNRGNAIMFYLSAYGIQKNLKSLLLFFKFYLLISFGCTGLRCCAWAFSGCGLSASHCSGLSCRAWAPGCMRFSSCAARLSDPRTCGIFPDQGLNLCPLHLTTGPQGSPEITPFKCLRVRTVFILDGFCSPWTVFEQAVEVS